MMMLGVVLILPSCQTHGSNAISIPRPQDIRVAAVHRGTVLIRPVKLSDSSQNQRTKSQYPDAPRLDANARRRKSLRESDGITANKGAITIARNVVTPLKTVAAAINAILRVTDVPYRSDRASDVA
jgi:hypothetical protein